MTGAILLEPAAALAIPVGAVVPAAAVGAVWGFLSDRLAARWPAHDDGSVRPIDWRTAVAVAGGGLAAAVLAARAVTPTEFAFFAVYLGALVVLLATDLDQRLLPDAITLPLIPLALVAAIASLNPLVVGLPALAWAIAAGIAVSLILWLLSIPFGQGAIGMGDLKLLISVGIVAGPFRLLSGLLFGSILAGVVILLLIAARRITLRTHVPYGPFLIIGAVWAILGALP